MVFDSEEHKQIVMALIEKAQFPGSIVETVATLKKSAGEAKIEPPRQPEHTPSAS